MVTRMDLSWVFGSLILEALGVLIIVIITIAVVLWRKQKKDAQGTQQLANNIQSEQANRHAEVEQLLNDVLKLDGDDKEEAIKRLMDVERDFYQEFMRMYLLRDHNAVAGINDKIRRLTAPYHDLVRREVPKNYLHELPPDVAQQIDYDPEEKALEAELEKLKAKNDVLATDIALHQELLNRVYREYTALFGGELSKDTVLTAQEIQKRMESGSFGKPEAG